MNGYRDSDLGSPPSPQDYLRPTAQQFHNIQVLQSILTYRTDGWYLDRPLSPASI